MNLDGEQNEQFINDDDAKRIKRDMEYNFWKNSNKKAIEIQKVYRGHLEKTYLLKTLESKYCQDMK